MAANKVRLVGASWSGKDIMGHAPYHVPQSAIGLQGTPFGPEVLDWALAPLDPVRLVPRGIKRALVADGISEAHNSAPEDVQGRFPVQAGVLWKGAEERFDFRVDDVWRHFLKFPIFSTPP